MLKIGELAKRSGLTVRTLHHYDDIGLLCPSARSDAGYRLYHRDDIARLHQIQALRRFGLSLTDIGAFLDRPDGSLAAVLDRQITALDTQLQQTAQLREQLQRLHSQVTAGTQPDLAEWLTTLELMTMYDQYFTKEELAELPFLAPDTKAAKEWSELVQRVKTAMGKGPATPAAQALAMEWMAKLEWDTRGNADIAVRLTDIQMREQAVIDQNGIDAEVLAFIREAYTQKRLAIFKKYLLPHEYAYMDANCRTRAQEWPALIAAMHKAMTDGQAPKDPAVRALALKWLDLSRDLGGEDPATHARIRLAYEREPDLMVGTWISDDMKPFIGGAIAAAVG
ncbi:MerR family transcriptional regulator [Massilia sp. CF038]|uniref:MerR family transcriptional regulator n=1 Tax=Massilia sp. CF038 TaxID=1881045 RepID=UPI00091C442C|nr:MerR family transcriptional regulator [Massilia sp. CF038]SHH05999.1 DNA-binding transcriptional regulator, MerR family [Massilia sp. CF038]